MHAVFIVVKPMAYGLLEKSNSEIDDCMMGIQLTTKDCLQQLFAWVNYQQNMTTAVSFYVKMEIT